MVSKKNNAKRSTARTPRALLEIDPAAVDGILAGVRWKRAAAEYDERELLRRRPVARRARGLRDMLDQWIAALENPDTPSPIREMTERFVWNAAGRRPDEEASTAARFQVFIKSVRIHAIGVDMPAEHGHGRVAVVTPRRAARKLVDEFAGQFPDDAPQIDSEALARAFGVYAIAKPGRTHVSKYELLERAIANTSFARPARTIEEAIRRVARTAKKESRQAK